MAFSAHKDPAAMVEHFDSAEELEAKARQLVQWIQKSRHFISYTGAGISTAAGIPDFRGPEGVWTLQAQGKFRTSPTVSTLKAMPTVTHMSLVKLQDENILKYIISQNCDGLHRRSGIRPDKISELHGNTNKEICKTCGKEYIRDFRTRTAGHVFDHKTGRFCTAPSCQGELHDSIINFGENLPERPLALGFENAESSDLCLVLGSSCTVSPANSMPKKVGKNKHARLVICNLQKTPLDHLASLRIYARCDDLMQMIMDMLGLTVPTFVLQRRLRLVADASKKTLGIQGLDHEDDVPASFIRRVEAFYNPRKSQKEDEKPLTCDAEPFSLPLERKPRTGAMALLPGNTPIRLSGIRLHFMGHYNEPALDIPYALSDQSATQTYALKYNPLTGLWVVRNEAVAEEEESEGEGEGEGESAMDDEKEKETEGRGESEMDTTEDGQGRKKKNKKKSDRKNNSVIAHSGPWKVLVGNSVEQLDTPGDKNAYRWRMYVKNEDGGELEGVERVVYHLHPTFFPANHTLWRKDYNGDDEYDYPLERRGWGTFEVGVEIHLDDGATVLRTNHMLSFDDTGAEAVHTL